MGDELATSNVNRSYSLAATSIAIFTFILFFLYPRFASSETNALLFSSHEWLTGGRRAESMAGAPRPRLP